MISKVIDEIDNDLDFYVKKWGLVTTIEGNEGARTGKYLQKGEFINVADVDKYAAVCYWKINGDVDSERVYFEESNEPFYRVIYPMVLRVFIKSNYFKKDNICTIDDIFYMHVNRITDLDSAERENVGVRQCLINFRGYSTEKVEIIKEDFGGNLNVPLDYHIMSIKVDVEIVVHARCLTDNC